MDNMNGAFTNGLAQCEACMAGLGDIREALGYTLNGLKRKKKLEQKT